MKKTVEHAETIAIQDNKSNTKSRKLIRNKREQKIQNEESVAYVHYFDFLFKFQGVKNPGKFQLDMILKEPWWY